MDAWHGPAPQDPARTTGDPARETAGTLATTTPTDSTAPGFPAAALDVFGEVRRRTHAAHADPAGAAWLASADPSPRTVAARWTARPTAPAVLPCGTVFDVVDLPALFGRRMLEQLWTAGPGRGPVAVRRGRVLVFAAPGTAQRLPSLLGWEEWARAVPPLLFHGAGDAVTVPPPRGCAPDAEDRWVVAPRGGLPGERGPWLPGAAVLLWACVRAARRTPARTTPPLVRAPGGL
nr:bifunctional DNA primase/polymerase [Streptomyces sp. HPF1205]